LFNYMIKPQNSFEPYPKNSLLGLQKVINDQKLSQNQKLVLKKTKKI